MVVGVVLGLTAPGLMQGLRSLEFGAGSQINVPIAILIWLMITPMMMKVDFASIRDVGRRPRGLFVTLFVNWLVKPFSMAAIAWLFFRYVFSPLDLAGGRRPVHRRHASFSPPRPCTAMVFVWSYLTDGDPAYTLVQVSVNDLLMLVLFAPIVTFLVSGASSLACPVPGAAVLGAGLHRHPADRRRAAAAMVHAARRAARGSRTCSCRASRRSAWRPCSPRSC